jgi:hypothetical protein
MLSIIIQTVMALDSIMQKALVVVVMEAEASTVDKDREA